MYMVYMYVYILRVVMIREASGSIGAERFAGLLGASMLMECGCCKSENNIPMYFCLYTL